MHSVSPLTWRNIVGYGLGDLANNLVFTTGMLFLLNYYTDVVGIGAATAGSLLLIIRIYSAVIDVVAGRTIDRTSTRWGRFRPFLLWGALPLLLLNVAVFSVPTGWDASWKLAYASATYGLLVTAYSFVNISYGSLAAVMTQDSADRAYLGASRTFMSVIPGVSFALLLGTAMRNYHGAAFQHKLTLLMLTLAAVGVVLYFLCFKYTREVVSRDIESPKFMQSIGTLLKNTPLLILCASMLIVLIGVFSMNASIMYFARYVLGDTNQLFLIIGITSIFGTLVAAPLAPILVKRFGKKSTCLLGLGITSMGYFALFISPISNKFLMFCSFGFAGIGIMTTGITTWALASDTVEYGEWRTGMRIEGLGYSLFSCARKCGQALGGSVPAFLLASSGYVPNLTEQSENVQRSIIQAVALVPAVAFALALMIMLFYPLTDRRFMELVEEIKIRRNAIQPRIPQQRI